MNHSQVILSTVHCKYQVNILAVSCILSSYLTLCYSIHISFDIAKVHSNPRMSKITAFFLRICTPYLLQCCRFFNNSFFPFKLLSLNDIDLLLI